MSNDPIQERELKAEGPAQDSLAFPMSFAQQRLWFLDEFDPGNTVYNVVWPIRLRGRLNIEALQASLVEIVRRHEVLRATFRTVGEQPVQIIAPPGHVPFAREDLTSVPAEERETRLQRLVQLAQSTPINLREGPILRAQLVRLAEDEHALVLALHHIVCDRWSRAVFYRELSALYDAFAAGKPSPLPDLPLQYTDYSVWQRDWLRGKNLDKQLSFWKELLHDAPAALELPADRPRPATPSFQGEVYFFSFSKEQMEALKALGRKEGATLFMVILAGFQSLLTRYSGQEDIVVGTPIANRNRVELENLIGFFANTLALRASFAGDPTFRELLAQVRESALGAYAHQDLPFEKLVEELNPERSLSHSAIFQVLLAVQNAPKAQLQLSGLVLEDIPVRSTASKFDLALFVDETADGARGRLEYNTDIFERETVDRMMRHLQQLLTEAVRNPDARVSDLEILAGTERSELLIDWNATSEEYPREKCLHQMFELQAARTPDAHAVSFDDVWLSYRQLNEQANRLAHYLQKRDIGPGKLVGIYVERSIEMMIALLAVQKAGAAYVPIDPGYPADRIGFMLEDAQPPVLLTQEPLLNALPQHSGETLCLDRDRSLWAQESTENPASVVKPGDLVYVIFTSGSTGRPKGVQLPHGAVVNLLTSMARILNMGERDSLVALASFAFDMCIPELYLPLISGGEVVVGRRDLAGDGEALAALLNKVGATLIHATPTTWNLLLDAGYTGAGRKRVVGAEPLPKELFGRLLDSYPSLYNFYGPTETCVWSTYAKYQSRDEALTIGRPLANTQIYILDRNQQPVPVGVAGELYIGGDGVAAGYLKQPELTAEKFVPDPFSARPGARLYRTGDLARYLADGRVDFLGRIDNQVKVRGYRIELGEIEAVLSSHGAVQQAVAVVREDRPGDKRLIGYVVTLPGHSVTPAELRALVKSRLPDYMVPSGFVFLDKLPLNANGKVDRKALQRAGTGRIEADTSYTPPRTPTEGAVAGIWAEVLRLEAVGVHDDFFALGGHSLLATQVVSRVRRVFDVDLPLRAIFESPTVAGLAEKIEEARRLRTGVLLPPLVPSTRSKRLPLSFAQQRLWVLEQLGGTGAAYNIPMALRITGPLEVRALEQSLTTIVARHEALRTTFAISNGEAEQVVHPPSQVSLPVTDLSDLNESEREGCASHMAGEEAQKTFDLAHGPLYRFRLLRLGAEDHVLLATCHHLVFDGWSARLFVSELSALYEAGRSGRAAALPELPLQYADYACWQQKNLSGGALQKQLAYWKEALKGAPASINLPTDRPRPAVQTFRGASQTVVLPVALLDELKKLGQREGATLFMTLLATLNVLLARYSGQEDIVVGSPIAGRNSAELEKLLGLFVNTLVLRTDLSESPSFRELLARVRHTALDAYTYQDLPFEKLVEELRPERDLSRNPIFQVMFVLHNQPVRNTEIPGLVFSRFARESGAALFDLSVFANETREGLLVRMEYNTDLFDDSTISRALAHLRTLLESAVADPGLKINQLAMLGDDERRTVVEEFNRTEADFPLHCIHKLFEQAAMRMPNATALVCGRRRLSYRELDERANQIAHYLIDLGAGPDILVGVFMERTLDLVPAILGVLKSGAAYVPLDPNYPRERLAAILEDAKAPVVITQRSLAQRIDGAGAEIVCLDSENAKLARYPVTDPDVQVKPEHLGYVLFTSGSTGRPKGVALEHRGAATFVRWAQTVFTPEELAGVLLSTSVCFDLSVFEIFVPLSVGGKIIVVPNALYLPTAEARDEVTLINTVPSAIAELVRMRAVPSSVKTVNLAGEALGEAMVTEIYASTAAEKVYNLYGPTEDTTYSTYTLVKRNERVTIGRPLPNTQAYVLDSNKNPQPIGVPGELYLAGAGLARGYYGRPDLTRERFLPNPFGSDKNPRMYKTGDLCRWREDGTLEYLGRLDHQVKLRGFRIELGEIETVMAKHPDVRQCLVMAREDEPGLKRLVAYVVAREGRPLTEESLTSRLRQSLPEFMVPTAFVLLDEFPLTPNGKVDRNALPAPEFHRTRGMVPPRDETEEMLVEIWRELLGIQEIGVQDNFFELGGHSLLAVRMINEISKAIGKPVTLAALFKGATIEALAAALREESGHMEQIVTEIQRGGQKPPLFLIVVPGMNALGYVSLARHLSQEQPVYKIQGPGPRLKGRPYSTAEYDEFAAEYLRAMKTVQPQGPYYLGGMCEGARIAFDMARSLEANGEEVRLLAVFDTWPVENTQIRSLWMIDYYYNRVKTFLRSSRADKRQLLAKLLGKKATKTNAAIPQDVPGKARPLRWPEVYWPGKDFVPPKFGGKITLFRRPWQAFYYIRDPQMGWGSRATAGVEVHTIPIYSRRHILIFREPNVQLLADKLSRCLRRAQERDITAHEMEEAVMATAEKAGS